PEVAVAAAVATAASPFLTRRPRRLVWAAVALVSVARIYVGAHLPVDTVGGFAVGWVAGALVHLAFGAPGGRPVLAAVRETLAATGLPVDDLAPAGLGRRGSAVFTGHAADGTAVFCRAVGRDERDADFLDKAWRAVALRDQRDQPFFTSIQAVEHEAYLALLAERAGVRTPAVWVTAGFAGGAVLVEEQVTGTRLSAEDPTKVREAVLDDVWRAVATLHAAHLTHGALRADNVYVAGARMSLVDWADGRSAATERQVAEDIAELLVSLAVRVGAKRAVASAARGLGAAALVPVLPLLQPVVLSSTTRREERAHKGLLDELRAEAARVAGVDEPKLEPLTRIRPETIVVVAVLALGVHLLAPQVGELGRAFEAIRESNPGWLALALVASLLTYVAGGWSQTGAVRQQLALTRTTGMQLAAAFTSRLTPASLGTLAVRIRFLQRSGLSSEEAVTGTALNSVAGGIARLVAIAAAIPLIGSSGFSGGVHKPADWEILAAVVVVGAIAGVVFFTAIGRRLLQPIRRAFKELAVVLRDPAKALALLGGALAVIALNIICFAAALAAVHAHVGASTAIVVYLGGSTVGGAAPTPGGLGAVEAALVAGLTAAGVDASLGVAGVLTFRLLTYWLPIPLGYASLRVLRREGLL
ncbi:MAG TPA: lysylphosphatidylglycerol synthase domain-containing protein, partial [Actinomycetota bacterium]|nr:lysylphosphatidylglycerol synthase domain-containing protein [Actinomycetota bacterium]